MENVKNAIEKRIEKKKEILEGELGELTKRLSKKGIIIEDYTEGENIIWLNLELSNGWVTVLKIDRKNIALSVYEEAMGLDIINVAMLYYNDDISFRKKPLKNVLRELTNYKNILTNIAIELLDEEGYFNSYLLNENLKIKILQELGDFFYINNGIFKGEIDYTVNSIDHINTRLVEFYNQNIIEINTNQSKKQLNQKIINSLEDILNNKF